MNAIIDAALAKNFGLNAEEYDRVLAIMGRTPSFTELGIFSVMWSEHCSYKSSRVFLRELPTTGPWGDPWTWRKRGRCGYRRRAGRHFQDGEPQPPQFYRTLSGGCHRRGRHFARCFYHGRAADRQSECAAIR